MVVINPLLKKALEKVGIEELNELQKKTFVPVRKGDNVLIIAPTGSGKTEAALIPLLDRALEEKWGPLSILYITPLRALNRDMLRRVQKIASELGLSVSVRHGDTSGYERHKQLKNPPHILITTPESLQAILPAKKMGELLVHVKAVVIDEAHELVGEKRGYQLSIALERLSVRAGEFQRIGLSATVGDVESTKKLITGKRSCKVVDVTSYKEYRISVLYPRPDKEAEDEAKKLNIPPDTYTRLKTILNLLNKHKQVITFVNTRNTAETLSFYLKQLHKSTDIHHSSLSRDLRTAVESLFKEGKIKHVIATSSLELGIDVGNVDAVIQYGSPRQVIRLVQRVGRAGHRWDRPSVGYIIATNATDYIESVAITELQKEGFLEYPAIEEKPYDVLAHQVAGIVLELGEASLEDILTVVSGAFPYFNITREEVMDVVLQLASERIVKVEGDRIRPTRWTRKYYYENLSMIPDEVKYFVVEIGSKRNVAMLDEEFVAEYLEPNTLFIVGGKTWKVVGMEGRNVYVEEYPVSTGAIPAWIGEQIPVYREVAERVKEYLKRGVEVEELKGYKEEGVVVEYEDRYVLVHTFLGSRANQTLARIISGELSRLFDIQIRTLSSPYTVLIEFPVKADPDIVVDVLKSLTPHMVDVLLDRIIPRTSLFRTRFIHVARRFGLIGRDISVERVNLRKLIEALTDSPVFKETLKEIYAEKLDVNNVKEFIDRIKDEEIKLISGFTPFGRLELSSILHMPDIISPENPEKVLANRLRERVSGKTVTFICTHCGFYWKKKVGEVEEPIRCIKCGSPMIAITDRPEEDREIIKKDDLSLKERHRLNTLLKSAYLIQEYGKKAVEALSVDGVGPSTADRVLRKSRTEEEFWLELLRAERDYYRTRMFWKS